MKTKQEIENKLEHAKLILVDNKTKYSQLNQIDSQSSTGSNLRKEIAQTEGIITALKWMLGRENTLF